MPQGVLPYKYEEEKTGPGMTALAGLPLYLDLITEGHPSLDVLLRARQRMMERAHASG